MQQTKEACTNLTFNVFLIRDHEELLLYPDGSCKDANLSQSSLHIQLLPCICPNGFKPDSKEESIGASVSVTELFCHIFPTVIHRHKSSLEKAMYGFHL